MLKEYEGFIMLKYHKRLNCILVILKYLVIIIIFKSWQIGRKSLIAYVKVISHICITNEIIYFQHITYLTYPTLIIIIYIILQRALGSCRCVDSKR